MQKVIYTTNTSKCELAVPVKLLVRAALGHRLWAKFSGDGTANRGYRVRDATDVRCKVFIGG
jgi:hypothetical protein